MVPFAGWKMPVQYTGILAEHRHTRSGAGLFDVSHMGQVRLHGDQPTVLSSLEFLSPSDLSGLPPMRQCYSLLLNEEGGIEDDCMIGRADDFVWMVVNATRTEHDLDLIRQILPASVQMEYWSQRALLALQGPAAAPALQSFCPEVADFPFMGLLSASIEGIPCLIARSGYTGEDGFEISCAAQQADALARLLLTCPGVMPAGLGARDSLRLEAGLCLYGQDLQADTTPAEAGLSWVVARSRRTGNRANFAGANRVLAELSSGPKRRRMGLQPDGRRQVRSGALLFCATGADTEEQVGEVTSGGFAPSLNRPYAMGYVRSDVAIVGQKLSTEVRGQRISMTACNPAQIKRKPN